MTNLGLHGYWKSRKNQLYMFTWLNHLLLIKEQILYRFCNEFLVWFYFQRKDKNIYLFAYSLLYTESSMNFPQIVSNLQVRLQIKWCRYPNKWKFLLSYCGKLKCINIELHGNFRDPIIICSFLILAVCKFNCYFFLLHCPSVVDG